MIMGISLRTKINLYVSLSIISVTIISSGFFFFKYYNELDKNITSRLNIGAKIAAGTLDLNTLSNIHDAGFQDSEVYKQTLSRLDTLEQSFGFSSIYLCIRENGRIIFTYDSGDIPSTSDNTFLTAYTDAPPQLDEVFSTGKSAIAEYSDKWGNNRSVFLPVKDGSGRLIGVLGADYSLTDVKNEFLSAYIAMLIILISVIILTLAVIFILRFSITGRILAIMKDISSIAEDSDLTRRTAVTGNDEIGVLAERFNTFLEKSAENVRNIEETSAHLSLAATEMSEISSIFTATTQVQAENTGEVVQTVENITSLINTIVTLSGEQLEIFVSQKKLIGDLYSGIQAVNGQADLTMSLSVNVSSHAKEGEESLSTMNKSMDKVMKSSNDMIGIIEIINDISDRINLLSLNAAIEAARAGDAGRGFAVVAEEISKLADQTATSTKNIDSLIKANSEEISREIANLNATTAILRQIITGVEEMKKEIVTIQATSKEQLATAEKVRGNAGNIYSRAEDIKSSADSQKHELDQITFSIKEIEQNTKAVICGSQEIAENSHSIADTSKTLKKQITVFKF
jgi:methyl-accepting chemotaxis protein